MKIPRDICRRVEADFHDDADEVIRVLENLAESVDDPRVLRCVVHLSIGDLVKLRHNADVAKQDFRDVIWWAEYDGGEEQLRDFRKPFGRDVA